ncbi:MAG: cobalt-precorrin-5B (C(1))-methyltransferase CbiD [Desulfurivibrionaceae bacterium]
MARRLRSGYTTGACAAAAAKAAVVYLVSGAAPDTVEIPFPDGSRHRFSVRSSGFFPDPDQEEGNGFYRASVIKDAGDDPDVTNRAEIAADVRFPEEIPDSSGSPGSCFIGHRNRILLSGGPGVGRVTKPGLAVGVGEPAINSGPRQMIAEAVEEGLQGISCEALQIVVSIPGGEELAGRTLNRRLGILGGLSILGTTGIVRPVSAEAWTATIKASLDVAREAGITEVILSTGRRSEKGVQKILALPEEACAMMGDYLEFSVQEAARREFRRIHLAGMWAKIMKAALEIPQTHVKHGPLEVRDGVSLLVGLGADQALQDRISGANTAREIYEHLKENERFDLIKKVCRRAKGYAEEVGGIPVTVYLVDSSGRVVEHV